MSRLLVAVLLALPLALGLAAPAAQADVVWLCRPGITDDPCKMGLETTVRDTDGNWTVETPERDRNPGIDCFYVYPTVSNQLTPNADKSLAPEVRSIAKFQAARFTQHCRVFAPVYRQSTLASIATGYLQASTADRQLAYRDVLEAWHEYLERDNRGRGVVLIGHSQGTSMLRQLLRREIEPDPAQLRRIVSAVLLGGNVTVAAGSDVGGDFRHTPLCTKRAQLRCVVAYSTFAEDPPGGARFGRTAAPAADNPTTLPGGPGTEVACTDPRPLAGVEGPLRALVPSEGYAFGLIGIGVLLTYLGPPPSAPTPWVAGPDRFAGSCRWINGAHVLRIEPLPGSRRPGFFPEPTWGTHLIDMNLGYEPLVSLVGQQARRWTKPDLRLTRRCVRGKLRTRVTGAEAEHVRRVSVRRRGTRLRAVVELTAGPERVVLERSRPRC